MDLKTIYFKDMKIYNKMRGGIVISQAPGSEVEADMSRVVQPQEFESKEESDNGETGATTPEDSGHQDIAKLHTDNGN